MKPGGVLSAVTVNTKAQVEVPQSLVAVNLTVIVPPHLFGARGGALLVIVPLPDTEASHVV